MIATYKCQFRFNSKNNQIVGYIIHRVREWICNIFNFKRFFPSNQRSWFILYDWNFFISFFKSKLCEKIMNSNCVTKLLKIKLCKMNITNLRGNKLSINRKKCVHFLHVGWFNLLLVFFVYLWGQRVLRVWHADFECIKICGPWHDILV